ncbi:dihydropteroate synthase [Verrucomicrobium spinosum]|uniref:dihydropteroate synthase n=1 Tax=Verrucomicrobium spinosum TaxID=2736 RepID=UPI0001746356|nr:dihydropteroate synthase [Verrucomicrobium spinosum]
MGTLWRIHHQNHEFTSRGWIMGVLNVTPDSFSDGGRFFGTTLAVERGMEMAEDGADVLDVGGESTRPGAEPVNVADEIKRVVPVISELRGRTRALISIDTMKPEVAREAVAAGADIVNDVNGLREPGMLEAVAGTSAGVIVMHMQGTPRTMQAQPYYRDVVQDVRDFFVERLDTLARAGIDPLRVALDPGFGFGKTLAHNLELLNGLDQLRMEDRPFVLGVSRKSMLGTLLGDSRLEHRAWPTVALTSWMRESGGEIIRVHDVKPNAQAMRMTEAIIGPARSA